MNRLSFRREPAAWIAFIGSGLSLVAAFGLKGLSPDQVTLIVAALNAVCGAFIAATTRPIAPSAYTAAVTAVAALATGYGLNVPGDTVAAINFVILNGFALLARAQITPVADPRPIS